MSIKATLIVGSDTFNLLSFSWNSNQPTDETGRACAIPGGGYLAMEVEHDSQHTLANWYVHPTLLKSGKVIIVQRTGMGNYEIVFTDAYCVHYGIDFKDDTAAPLVISFALSARELSVGTAVIAKNWPQ